MTMSCTFLSVCVHVYEHMNVFLFMLSQNLSYQVRWTRLYKSTSGLDGGTLFQLRNRINRRNVTSDVQKDMNG